MIQQREKKAGNHIVRFFISLGAVVVPVVLLYNDIYGSFLYTFTIPLLWEIGVLGNPVSSLGLRRDKRIASSLLWGLISGIILGILGGFAIRFAGISYTGQYMPEVTISLPGLPAYSFSMREEAGFRLLTSTGNVGGFAASILFSVFLIGLGEELFWRGFIQQKLIRLFSGYSKHIAVWVSSIAFGTVHIYLLWMLTEWKGILFMALIAIAGAIWGYLYIKFKNIWVAALSHGFAAFILWRFFFFSTLPD